MLSGNDRLLQRRARLAEFPGLICAPFIHSQGNFIEMVAVSARAAWRVRVKRATDRIVIATCLFNQRSAICSASISQITSVVESGLRSLDDHRHCFL
jgi:hypothetical protein